MHVGRWDELDGLVDAAYERFGKVDVLINNAGMSPLYESLSTVTEKLFDAVVNLNFKGPFRLSTLVGERMVADGGGSIINVSSSGSRRPRPEMLPYPASKAALNALTEGLALAFGPTVTGEHLDAGPFLTDISKAWDIDATTKGRSRTSRCSGWAIRPRSSAPHCSWPRMRRASPVAGSSGWTAAFRTRARPDRLREIDATQEKCESRLT